MTAGLGWLGSALVVASLMQRDLRRVRLVNLTASIVLLAFNAIIGLASMVALNVVLVGVNLYHLGNVGPASRALVCRLRRWSDHSTTASAAECAERILTGNDRTGPVTTCR